MKRYHFRLAAVARLRRAEQEVARNALAVANAALRARLVERDAEVERYRTVANQHSATTPAGLSAERNDAELALERLRAAEQRVAEAASTAAIAQVTWLAAHQKVAALERLEQRQREEHALATSREEAALLDDLSTARYLADKASGSAR
ncbi:MAG: hypothetical protein M0004_02555 [Actinomycetota bacterium]|nr:hypothetical protein [Actinomycetota bacterium]